MHTSIKTCFKCGCAKALSEFYAHPQMADGHLNKCKDCTRKDSETRRSRLEVTDVAWVISERERHREKSARQRLLNPRSESPADRKARLESYRVRHPERNRARRIVQYYKRKGTLIPQRCECCGFPITEAHHDDYGQPLKVRWLCKRHHMERHIELNTLSLPLLSA